MTKTQFSADALSERLTSQLGMPITVERPSDCVLVVHSFGPHCGLRNDVQAFFGSFAQVETLGTCSVRVRLVI